MREIVGVIADVREGALDDEVWPAEYEAIYQGPDNFFAVAVRTAQDEKSILPVLVSTLHQIDPNLGVYGETDHAAADGSTRRRPCSIASPHGWWAVSRRWRWCWAWWGSTA